MDLDKWGVFNFILSENINSSISEQLFESKVIQAFGEIGWKEYTGNIKVRPSYRIGSTGTIEPDLVFRSDNQENLFVVEIKRPDSVLSTTYKDQLFSYMRQLKLDIGILIGEEIQVFYDEKDNKDKNPIHLTTINFGKDSVNGKEFVELFDKSNFSDDAVDSYIKESLKKLRKKEARIKFVNTIFSENFKPHLLQLIKQSFAEEYDAETIDSVLDKLNIEISNKELPNSNYKPIHKIEDRKELLSDKIYNTSGGALPIELNPPDEYDFKRKLLKTKTAWITVHYLNGKSDTNRWDAYKMNENSNLLGNLRSRPNFRNGQWQKLGIKKVSVSIETNFS